MSKHSRKILPIGLTEDRPFTDTSKPDSLQVFITKECVNEYYRAYYQLAHEAVHTLSPVSYKVVSWLEEGVAVKFSREFLAHHCNLDWNKSSTKEYDLACKKVTELLGFEPKAIATIMDSFGCLSGIEQQEMCKLFPSVPESLIVELCTPFN